MRTVSHTPLFLTSIFSGKLDLDTDSIVEHCYLLKSQTPGREKSNLGGWQSHDMNGKNVFLQEAGLIKDIEQLAETYARDVLRLHIRRWGIDNLWININGKGASNSLHTHPLIQVAGVYYLKVPEDSNADLVFSHPGAEIMQRDLPDRFIAEANPSNASAYYHTPEVDQIVLFPGWLQHYVMPNQSDEDRISISFNVCFH